MRFKSGLLWVLVVFYLLTGLYLVVWPFDFYTNAPGVAATGPYNMHFIIDVGFAFSVSALAIGYGLLKRLKPLLIFGSAWIALHGMFHLVLFILHSDPMSTAALTDMVVVIFPAALASYLCLTFEEHASL